MNDLHLPDKSWAYEEIACLRAALTPFAHFMDIWEQQMKGGNTAKTGAIYTVENRAGVAEITVEALREAREVLRGTKP